MKRLFRLLMLAFFWFGFAAAQTATVKRNVNLHSKPSNESDIVEKLNPPAQVQLVESNPTRGYYHVTARDGKHGWVWGKNLSIQQQTPTVGPTTPGAREHDRKRTSPSLGSPPNWQ